MLGSIGILRFINYGNTMSGSEIDSDEIIDKHYWSFLELSNGRIVSIMTTCYLMSAGGVGDCDLQILPTACYSFGENFWEWWKKTFEYDEKERAQENLTEEEYLIAKDFYIKSIFTTRDISTEIVYCD